MAVKPYKEYGKFKEILNQENSAAVNRITIEMVYYNMSRKKETRRQVGPYRIWFFNGTLYLIGLCHMRNEVRIFALDRIKMCHKTKTPTKSSKISVLRISRDGVLAFIRASPYI